jgi:hypothetical protein
MAKDNSTALVGAVNGSIRLIDEAVRACELDDADAQVERIRTALCVLAKTCVRAGLPPGPTIDLVRDTLPELMQAVERDFHAWLHSRGGSLPS